GGRNLRDGFFAGWAARTRASVAAQQYQCGRGVELYAVVIQRVRDDRFHRLGRCPFFRKRIDLVTDLVEGLAEELENRLIGIREVVVEGADRDVSSARNLRDGRHPVRVLQHQLNRRLGD